MAGRLSGNSAHLDKGAVTVVHTLVNDVQRQFSDMLFTLILLLNVFDKFFSLRPAALVEAWVDGVFVGIDQFTHRHTKQQGLAVTFRDAETA